MAYEHRHPRKLSFGDNCVPKCNLGTRGNENENEYENEGSACDLHGQE
jgi:hypothetical protein